MTDPIDRIDPIRLFDKPLADDFTDADLEITAPMDYAVGIEAVEDLIADLDQALAASTRA